MTYAQDGEDRIALNYFGPRKARLLEVGAYDGKCNSNTFALLESGWTGVLVEASVTAFRSLLAQHGHTDGVVLVHGAMGAASRLTPWWEHSPSGRPSQASTSVLGQYKRMCDIQKPTSPKDWHRFFVPEFTVDQLLQALPGPYAYISIDTEGTSVPLFESFDLRAMGAELVCVEHNEKSSYVPEGFAGAEHRERAVAHCRQHGLTDVLFDNGVNVICGRPK